MRIYWEDRLVRERRRFMETIESLSDEEFETGPTLCELWAPRDVLAHVIGTDHMSTYLRPDAMTVNRGNARMVEQGRHLARAELTRRGWQAANSPTAGGRAWAWLLTGDAAMHHQDVLRGMGRNRELPEEVAPAIYREGAIWSWPFGAKLLRCRVVPTDFGLKPRGRGPEVRGAVEALSLWMAGRESVADELEFERNSA